MGERKLQLFERVGEGSFADVWRGSDETRTRVAVKIFRPGDPSSTYLEHSRQMARVTAHSNVANLLYVTEVVDPDTSETLPCAVLEFIEGATLHDRLYGEDCSSIDSATARRIGTDVLNGLGHIHSCGVPHGDLHAGNVMVTEKGHAKVIDVFYRGSLAALTTASQPERLSSDLKQLAVMLHHLLLRTDGLATGPVATFAQSTLGQQTTLESIAECFARVFDPPDPQAPTTRTDPVGLRSAPVSESATALIERSLEAIRARDRAGWKELVRAGRGRVPVDLANWRLTVGNIRDQRGWLDAIGRALDLVTPVAVPLMCAVEAEATHAEADTFAVLGDLMSPPDWDWTGLQPVADAPISLAFLLHHLIGAQHMAARSVAAAVGLLSHRVVDRDSGRPTELWRHDALMSYPATLLHASPYDTGPVEFAREFMLNRPWLDRFFAHDREKAFGLQAYRLAASTLELGWLIAQSQEPASAPIRVPPLFVLEATTEHGFERILQTAFPTGAEVDLVASVAKVNAASLRAAWPTWCRRWTDWFVQAGHRYHMPRMLRRAAGELPQLP